MWPFKLRMWNLCKFKALICHVFEVMSCCIHILNKSMWIHTFTAYTYPWITQNKERVTFKIYIIILCKTSGAYPDRCNRCTCIGQSIQNQFIHWSDTELKEVMICLFPTVASPKVTLVINSIEISYNTSPYWGSSLRTYNNNVQPSAAVSQLPTCELCTDINYS